MIFLLTKFEVYFELLYLSIATTALSTNEFKLLKKRIDDMYQVNLSIDEADEFKLLNPSLNHFLRMVNDAEAKLSNG